MVSVNPNVNVDFNVSANKYQTFGAGKKQNFTHDNKPTDDDRMKTSTKLMIGATAIGAVVAGALFVRHAAYKSFAKEFGIDDVSYFKKLCNICGNKNMSKIRGKLETADIENRFGTLFADGTIADGDICTIIPGKMAKNYFEKNLNKNIVDVPENSVMMVVHSKDNKTIKHSEIIFHDGLGDLDKAGEELYSKELCFNDLAKEVGITDTDLLKNLYKTFREIKKHNGKLNKADLINQIKSMSKEIKTEKDDKYVLMTPKFLQSLKDKKPFVDKMPENSFYLVITNSKDDFKCGRLVIYDELGDLPANFTIKQ